MGGVVGKVESRVFVDMDGSRLSVVTADRSGLGIALSEEDGPVASIELSAAEARALAAWIIERFPGA